MNKSYPIVDMDIGTDGGIEIGIKFIYLIFPKYMHKDDGFEHFKEIHSQ